MISFIQEHYNDIFTAIGYLVSFASIVVALTPSTRDDAILAKVVKVFDWFSVMNTKINQAKIDGTVTVENKGKVK